MEVEQKRRGPKKKFGPRQEVHLKFSPEVMAYIEAHSPQGYQAYFDELVKRDMEQVKESKARISVLEGVNTTNAE